MKRILNILAAVICLTGMVTSCEKAPKLDVGIVGEWQLSEMTGYEVSNLPTVYIEFTAEKSFVIYQKVGEVTRFKKYGGTYTIAELLLTGVYDDGDDWGSAYRASLEADGSVLVLTAVELDKAGVVVSEGEVTKYVRASLSQEEKDAADIVTKGDTASINRIM